MSSVSLGTYVITDAQRLAGLLRKKKSDWQVDVDDFENGQGLVSVETNGWYKSPDPTQNVLEEISELLADTLIPPEQVIEWLVAFVPSRWSQEEDPDIHIFAEKTFRTLTGLNQDSMDYTRADLLQAWDKIEAILAYSEKHGRTVDDYSKFIRRDLYASMAIHARYLLQNIIYHTLVASGDIEPDEED